MFCYLKGGGDVSLSWHIGFMGVLFWTGLWFGLCFLGGFTFCVSGSFLFSFFFFIFFRVSEVRGTKLRLAGTARVLFMAFKCWI